MRALVTGGGGFLGQAICRKLLAKGVPVVSFQRRESPELAAIGVPSIRGDLDDQEAVTRAAADRDIVFHVAARAGIWGPASDYERVNVTGTENVLSACRTQGIERLVYTSSPSVVFDGNDENGIDESTPYPSRFLAHYPRTKAIAEQKILAANNPELATVSLRPHLIWGPGDNHLLPRLVSRARAGALRLVGNGSNLVDHVYVDNAADAHLLAAERLDPDHPIAGKAYFITNGEPIPCGELIGRMLEAAGLPRERRSVPPGIAYLAGWVLETIHHLGQRPEEPRMTRFLARQLSRAHHFDLSAARRDLGYEPEIGLDEGMARLAGSFAPAAQDG